MSEFSMQSDGVDVVRIMEQIRDRIREKQGEDYTEEQIRELANVKLERFLEPAKVRSDLVEHYRRQRRQQQPTPAPPVPASFEFDPDTIYVSSRGLLGRILYRVRKLLAPLLKFFFNVGPIVHALQVQREINEQQAEFVRKVSTLFDLSSSRLAAREELDALNYEVMNNLVLEMTRLSIEMKNHRMLVESVAGRLDFNERRARALEDVVQYRDGSRPPADAGAGGGQAGGSQAGGGQAGGSQAGEDQTGEGQAESPEPRRRRRRRGRRRSARPASTDAEAAAASAADAEGAAAPDAADAAAPDAADAAAPEAGDAAAPPAGKPASADGDEAPAPPSAETDPPSR